MGNGVSRVGHSPADSSAQTQTLRLLNTLRDEMGAIKQQNTALQTEVAGLRALLESGATTKVASPTASAAAPAPTKVVSAPAPAAPAAAPAKNEPSTQSDSKLQGKIQVMISLNVASMHRNAMLIKDFLERNGVKSWVCTEMEGGIEFRDEIVDAVDSCRVFLPLINNAWAESPECEAEFNYAFRKNLKSSDKPRLPVILPICFPELDWNKYKHVRLLLASTNALVWSPGQEQQLLSSMALSMQRCGVKFASSSLSEWDNERVCKWLQDLLLRPVKEKNLTGQQLLSLSDQDFISTLGFSQSQAKVARAIIEEQGGSQPAAATIVTASTKDALAGLYKIKARTINDNDGNITPSNEFLVKLDDFGISSSGCVWGAGTKHNNYDGVTCVWQGTYQPDGTFAFEAKYSNDTHEEYAGRIVDGNVCSAKYAWWSSWDEDASQSYGTLDAVMHKLSDAEEKEANAAIQKMLETGEDEMHALSRIGRTLAFDQSFETRKEKWEENLLRLPTGGWVSTPSEPLAHSKPFIVRFVRPAGSKAKDEKAYIGLCPRGEETPWHEDAWFRAWDNRVKLGVIFYSELVPHAPGEFDLVYFSGSDEALARHPVTFLDVKAKSKFL